MNNQRVILAGGSGFHGRLLTDWFMARGTEVLTLTRAPVAGGRVREIFWDGRTVGEWHRELEGADAVINLAGTTTPKLAFYTSAGFISALTPQFRVYISTTYPGSGTPSTYFTTQLSASIAVPPASGFSSFLYSGLINLSAYAGQTIYIAYRYDGNDPSGTGSDATAK